MTGIDRSGRTRPVRSGGGLLNHLQLLGLGLAISVSALSDGSVGACQAPPMPRFDASSGSCRVFTFKQGLLSAVAHDLEIEVTDWSLEIADDGDSLTARFDPRSLRVLHAVVDGRPSASALSDKDKRKIESNIVADVLEVKRHPGPIELRSTEIDDRDDGSATVRGTLRLHGREREVTIEVRVDSDERVARARLHQPDFGIQPYSAMLGTLKIKPDIEVELRVPKS